MGKLSSSVVGAECNVSLGRRGCALPAAAVMADAAAHQAGWCDAMSFAVWLGRDYCLMVDDDEWLEELNGRRSGRR